MTQQELTQQTRQTMEKAAYAAVGAPVAAIKAMGARLSDFRGSVRASRRELGADLELEMNRWIAEGERTIDRAMRRVRSSEIANDAKSTATSTGRSVEEGMNRATRAIDETLEAIVPSVDVTTINGIGPNYAKQLAQAGVFGVAGFMSATGTAEDVAKLSAHTGFSTGTIESWRAQADLSRIDGVGGAYAQLLHQADVWTLRQLSHCDPDELADRLSSIDAWDAPEQMPSVYATKKWISQARRLVSAS